MLIFSTTPHYSLAVNIPMVAQPSSEPWLGLTAGMFPCGDGCAQPPGVPSRSSKRRDSVLLGCRKTKVFKHSSSLQPCRGGTDEKTSGTCARPCFRASHPPRRRSQAAPWDPPSLPSPKLGTSRPARGFSWSCFRPLVPTQPTSGSLLEILESRSTDP